MLARLSIRDIVLIDELELEFSRGLTILTGETGAGKSILLDALSLALGARGDGALVRAGAAQGQVTAVFEPPAGHPVFAALAAQDLAADGELILRRVQLADGRTRAYVNDQSVSAQTLRALAGGLVEIHGQHDERALLDAGGHRTLVDAYGGLRPLAEAVRAAHGASRARAGELAAARADVAAREREADFARHASEELTALAVEPGEEERLAATRQSMMQGEKVSADIRDALTSLSGDSAILPMLVSITRRLQRRAAQAPELIEPSVKALDKAMNAIELAAQSVEAAMRACALRSARTGARRGAVVRAARHGAQIRRRRRCAAGAGAEIRRRTRRPLRGPRPRCAAGAGLHSRAVRLFRGRAGAVARARRSCGKPGETR